MPITARSKAWTRQMRSTRYTVCLVPWMLRNLRAAWMKKAIWSGGMPPRTRRKTRTGWPNTGRTMIPVTVCWVTYRWSMRRPTGSISNCVGVPTIIRRPKMRKYMPAVTPRPAACIMKVLRHSTKITTASWLPHAKTTCWTAWAVSWHSEVTWWCSSEPRWTLRLVNCWFRTFSPWTTALINRPLPPSWSAGRWIPFMDHCNWTGTAICF